MPILNYTTEVDVMKSVGEVQGLLGSRGARQINVHYADDGTPEALEFLLILEQKPLCFRMPANVDGVLSVLNKQRISYKYQNREHAKKVTWRIIKNWLEAQLALIDAGQAQLAEIFLPYMEAGSGQTMFQRFLETHVRALPEQAESKEEVVS